MLFLSKDDYYRYTRQLYYENLGPLVFTACRHFRWNAMDQEAESIIIEDEGDYFCPCCGEKQTKETKESLEKLVDYINDGGRDEQIMTDLFKDVNIYEWAVLSPGKIVDNYASGGFSANELENSFGYTEFPVLAEDDDDAESEFDPADFMYWFEHRVLVDNFLEDPKAFIQRCLGTMEPSPEFYEEDTEDIPEGVLDNYIYGIFCLLAMKENIEHDLSAEDFTISERTIKGKYKVISITLPEPIRERLCYRMEIVYEEGKEEEARLLTVEKGEKKTSFLCSWVNRAGKLTHLNYDFVPKNSAKYDEIIVKIYEGKLKEKISYTPEDDD